MQVICGVVPVGGIGFVLFESAHDVFCVLSFAG
jgi:hypothetical protein